MNEILKAPFPWFGGKSRVSGIVWARFGDVKNYVEPFFGSGAVLLGRPSVHGTETVNDLDGYVANFWRATQHDPETTAKWASEPVNENDLHAKHVWLVSQRELLSRKLEGNPDWFDARIAGYWVWGVSCWIGSGFCSGKGPWHVNEDGCLVKRPHLGDAGQGVNRQLPHLGDAGQGVNRQRPHLGDAGRGVKRQLPHLGDAGQGVNRQLPHLGDAGQGVNRQRPHLGDAGRGVKRQLPHLGDAGQGVNRQLPLIEYFELLKDRLRKVRVASGDWSRVCGESVTRVSSPAGIFLDPPYADTAGRADGIYAQDSLSVAHDVRDWAIANGDDPRLRIALCGYDGEHAMPDSWDCVAWKASGGYGSQRRDGGNVNATKERIWFSPACLKVAS